MRKNDKVEECIKRFSDGSFKPETINTRLPLGTLKILDEQRGDMSRAEFLREIIVDYLKEKARCKNMR